MIKSRVELTNRILGVNMQKNDGNRNNNISLNTQKHEEDILYIGDRSFRKIKLGLAEAEVRSYVEELISQRDALSKRLEHLAALTELAEKTVIDANNLSQAMMKKATDQAKVEADSIRVTAEQETDQFVKHRKTEATAAAEKEAEIIKTEAQHQAKMIRERQLDGIKKEAANLAQKLQNDLIADIEAMKKNVLVFGTKFGETASNTQFGDGQESGTKLFKGEKEQLLNQALLSEIEIMPPIDIDKIMDLISHLEKLPEVKTTDVLPDTPNPIIRVFLNKPLPLVTMLGTIPQVVIVNDAGDSHGTDRQSGEKRERVQVTFDTNPSKKPLNRKDLTQKTAI
jgi:F0F1-type ATP synthase membrane subunit b/b'